MSENNLSPQEKIVKWPYLSQYWAKNVPKKITKMKFDLESDCSHMSHTKVA